jgi:hypothetical protein
MWKFVTVAKEPLAKKSKKKIAKRYMFEKNDLLFSRYQIYKNTYFHQYESVCADLQKLFYNAQNEIYIT